MKRHILLFLGLVLASPLSANGKLELLWEKAGFKNPESVLYDHNRNRLYVSNVDGGINEKDGKGGISLMSLEGDILDPEWIGGLHAPKGMAISAGRLYVADVDTLVEIDIETAAIVNRYTVDDAIFFNDVSATADGRIFVSDMMKNRIHLLAGGRFTIWLEDEALETPNGLHAETDRLVVGAWGVITGEGFETRVPGHLKAVYYQDKRIESIGEGAPVGNLDGVETAISGSYYVTDWIAGGLLKISPNGQAEMLLDLNQGSADHEYITEERLLLIPMLNDGTVRAYRAEH